MIAGRYSLEREVGRGGSGAVWLGRDETLGRRVALKRIGLLPGADSTDLARAEREARLSAQLHHPHVVLVYDVVVDGDSGARWLVMEYVEGPTLDALVRERGRLSPDEAAPLLWQVADALVAAHAAGIAHRDVKPSNVLLEHGRVAKLADFGIARVASDPSLTQTGMVTGSPAYLAPEIATGTGGGAAADVWSLGATAWHVLAGRKPYDSGDNVLGTLYRIVHEEPPRLEEAGWLAPVLAGTMVRDPGQRWSMAQVRDYLAAGRDATPAPPATAPPATAPLSPADEPTQRISPAVAAPAPVATGPSADDGRAGGRADQRADERADERDPRRRRVLLLGVAALLALVLLAVLLLPLLGDGGDEKPAASDPSASSTASASPSASPSPSPSPSESPAGPTAAGMEDFIRSYVATVAEDPDAAWTMLTPKFQRESGGIQRYRAFWDRATSGRVLSIRANPENLSVSYQVRFENFDNGPGPTVLDLAFDDGTYRIDGERSEGFTPAG
ncbi:serine/threonine-protein kinase [Nocardioides aurantiacus]|uniref:non-specific serine/threonine protein kinase n=1 Tax=Nocardioides aurantiacus TaxID=86796 RepID=A0A3N2CVI7_9ACTN|nr:serine/threonine-protein kinase [Nocardioides aurantiacus]ROR91565.1 serine/threonine protein kinase [Nocardioides aurantiacus]